MKKRRFQVGLALAVKNEEKNALKLYYIEHKT